MEANPASSPTSLADRAAAINWYHTIELEPGLVTEGVFDLRPYVDRYGLPELMSGMRVLEVGAFDGFWTFEMERRGAEVTAIDIRDDRDLDYPANRRPKTFSERPLGQGFALAKEAFGASAKREICSVYEATPERFGTFDMVFCGSVLIHLRDQVLALERIAGLCDDLFVTCEAYHRGFSLIPVPLARYRALRDSNIVFWEPNLKAWEQMLTTAGFGEVERRGRFQMKARDGWSVPHVVHHARKG